MAYGDVAIDITAGQLENAVKNFDTKADKTYVDGELATKANKVDVNRELETKASIEMVEGGLAQKRNFFTVDDTADNKTALGFDSYSGTDVLNVKRDGLTIITDEYGNLKVNTDNIASKAYVDSAKAENKAAIETNTANIKQLEVDKADKTLIDKVVTEVQPCKPIANDLNTTFNNMSLVYDSKTCTMTLNTNGEALSKYYMLTLDLSLFESGKTYTICREAIDGDIGVIYIRPKVNGTETAKIIGDNGGVVFIKDETLTSIRIQFQVNSTFTGSFRLYVVEGSKFRSYQDAYYQIKDDVKLNNFANAIKCVETGVAISFDDVSPNSHKVKISGTAGTRVSLYGKNLLYVPKIPETTKNGVTYKSNGDGSITLNGTSTEGFIIRLEDVNNMVTLSKGIYSGTTGSKGSDAKLNLVFFSSDNLFIVNGGKRVDLKITEPKTTSYAQIYVYPNKTFDNETIFPIVVCGKLDENYYLDFEKFKNPKIIYLDENGNGDIENISPNMTILSSSEVTVEYNKDISKQNKLNGKKCMFFGDSITDGIENYRGYLLKNTKMHEVASFAVSGATWRNEDSTVMDGNPAYGRNNTIPNQVQKLLNNQNDYEIPDIVLFFGGTNDNATDNTEIESQFTENSDYKTYIDVESCDLKSFAGAMRWCVEKVQVLYPNAKIFFVTNIQSASRYHNHQKSKRDKTISICERMSINVFDAFSESGIYSRFETSGANGKYLIDGLHPNDNGAKLIAKYIQKKLESEDF